MFIILLLPANPLLLAHHPRIPQTAIPIHPLIIVIKKHPLTNILIVPPKQNISRRSIYDIKKKTNLFGYWSLYCECAG